jgi:hypothetical protein
MTAELQGHRLPRRESEMGQTLLHGSSGVASCGSPGGQDRRLGQPPAAELHLEDAAWAD